MHTFDSTLHLSYWNCPLSKPVVEIRMFMFKNKNLGLLFGGVKMWGNQNKQIFIRSKCFNFGLFYQY